MNDSGKIIEALVFSFVAKVQQFLENLKKKIHGKK